MKLLTCLPLLFALCSCEPVATPTDSAQQEDLKRFAELPTPETLSAYQDAAHAGSGIAANKLSVLYLKADETTALGNYWTTVSAENGNAVGQFNLAMHYLDKENPLYSVRRAEFWLRKAADQGDSQSKRALSRIEQSSKHP